MKFKTFVKMGTAVTQIILAIIALMMMVAFAAKPTDSAILTNILLLILILVQLFAINVLISIYERLDTRRKR